MRVTEANRHEGMVEDGESDVSLPSGTLKGHHLVRDCHK
jgi:hypothetical protein